MKSNYIIVKCNSNSDIATRKRTPKILSEMIISAIWEPKREMKSILSSWISSMIIPKEYWVEWSWLSPYLLAILAIIHVTYTETRLKSPMIFSLPGLQCLIMIPLLYCTCTVRWLSQQAKIRYSLCGFPVAQHCKFLYSEALESSVSILIGNSYFQLILKGVGNQIKNGTQLILQGTCYMPSQNQCNFMKLLSYGFRQRAGLFLDWSCYTALFFFCNTWWIVNYNSAGNMSWVLASFLVYISEFAHIPIFIHVLRFDPFYTESARNARRKCNKMKHSVFLLFKHWRRRKMFDIWCRCTQPLLLIIAFFLILLILGCKAYFWCRLSFYTWHTRYVLLMTTLHRTFAELVPERVWKGSLICLSPRCYILKQCLSTKKWVPKILKQWRRWKVFVRQDTSVPSQPLTKVISFALIRIRYSFHQKTR